jgi:hypothetical protein
MRGIRTIINKSDTNIPVTTGNGGRDANDAKRLSELGDGVSQFLGMNAISLIFGDVR